MAQEKVAVYNIYGKYIFSKGASATCQKKRAQLSVRKISSPCTTHDPGFQSVEVTP